MQLLWEIPICLWFSWTKWKYRRVILPELLFYKENVADCPTPVVCHTNTTAELQGCVCGCGCMWLCVCVCMSVFVFVCACVCAPARLLVGVRTLVCEVLGQSQFVCMNCLLWQWSHLKGLTWETDWSLRCCLPTKSSELWQNEAWCLPPPVGHTHTHLQAEFDSPQLWCCVVTPEPGHLSTTMYPRQSSKHRTSIMVPHFNCEFTAFLPKKKHILILYCC